MKFKTFILTVLSILIISDICVYADNDDSVSNSSVIEVKNDDFTKREWIVNDNGAVHTLIIDYDEYYIVIDGEISNFTIKEITSNFRTTVDYASGIYLEGKIPWKGSVNLLAAAIGGMVGGLSASGIASTIAGALTADAENVFLSYTQYKSKEDYYSSYHQTYYKKFINKNVKFYKTSINSNNVICGPYDGTWFDPIRPE